MADAVERLQILIETQAADSARQFQQMRAELDRMRAALDQAGTRTRTFGGAIEDTGRRLDATRGLLGKFTQASAGFFAVDFAARVVGFSNAFGLLNDALDAAAKSVRELALETINKLAPGLIKSEEQVRNVTKALKDLDDQRKELAKIPEGIQQFGAIKINVEGFTREEQQLIVKTLEEMTKGAQNSAQALALANLRMRELADARLRLGKERFDAQFGDELRRLSEGMEGLRQNIQDTRDSNESAERALNRAFGPNARFEINETTGALERTLTTIGELGAALDKVRQADLKGFIELPEFTDIKEQLEAGTAGSTLTVPVHLQVEGLSAQELTRIQAVLQKQLEGQKAINEQIARRVDLQVREGATADREAQIRALVKLSEELRSASVLVEKINAQFGGLEVVRFDELTNRIVVVKDQTLKLLAASRELAQENALEKVSEGMQSVARFAGSATGSIARFGQRVGENLLKQAEWNKHLRETAAEVRQTESLERWADTLARIAFLTAQVAVTQARLAQRDFFAGMREGALRAVEAFDTLREQGEFVGRALVDSLGSAVVNTFDQIADGSIKAKNFFKAFAESMLRDIARMLAQLLAMRIAMAALGFLNIGTTAAGAGAGAAGGGLPGGGSAKIGSSFGFLPPGGGGTNPLTNLGPPTALRGLKALTPSPGLSMQQATSPLNQARSGAGSQVVNIAINLAAGANGDEVVRNLPRIKQELTEALRGGDRNLILAVRGAATS